MTTMDGLSKSSNAWDPPRFLFRDASDDEPSRLSSEPPPSELGSAAGRPPADRGRDDASDASGGRDADIDA